ncbi:signal transduction histidine kinase [Pullulanibacillus pueri]|uniref:histidine kinase n=1 Tax=Pullulanibacillus pueri TaxID=1437324 RepID=A0A8J2ZQN2_9BACL|nr:HAMP domain-containing sensor histidine kinase [Pullulanibacillus pueri]MBM7679960.1 signal transduction histidine kinase [Pullulanibacillus pueri]GGH73674.1 sensor histidine kinase [Pullulanibacillus pueri]
MDSTFLLSSKEKLIQYLRLHRSDLIKKWIDLIYSNKEDIYKERFPKHALALFALAIKSINNALSDQEIEKLANKIANERVQANVHIGDFVYSLNMGRTLLISFIHQSGMSIQELSPIVNNINSCFDRFSYYAVNKFTRSKEQELQDKVLYINQTHKDRLSLLGQMSSSFVHEFRNPLTSVMGFVKLIKAGQTNPMYLDIIERELRQLNFRITQFLHTSKIEIIDKEKKNIILVTLIDEVLDFIYPSLLDGDIVIETEFNFEKTIMANEDELKQVFINILLNSIDAVKLHKTPRKIKIKCYEEDEQIKISLTNNGPSIPENTLKTIFEPFYTTKELGTGIGLYVCKKIIEKHHGSISCHSTEEETTFQIVLPVS